MNGSGSAHLGDIALPERSGEAVLFEQAYLYTNAWQALEAYAGFDPAYLYGERTSR